MLAVLLLSVFVGYSQVHVKPGIGLTLTDYVNFGEYGAAAKVGTQLGGSVAIGKKFYVEPGVFYATKSAEFTTSSSTEVSKNTVKGIRVPVAVGLGVLGNEESLANLRVFGGGSGFFKTGVSGDINKDDVKSPQWGVFAGAGVDIWLLYVDLSYEWSVTEASSVIADGKARTFIATLGLKF